MYKTLIVAGTFDHLHKGHDAILIKAFECGEVVTIGLTSDKFVNEYKHQTVSPFDVRKNALVAWLSSHRFGGRVEIIPIDNPYEPAGSGEFEAIVVSTQTKPRAEEINRKRKSLGLSPLVIIEVAMQVAQDGAPISATRVRSGEIDTSGRLVLPDALRGELAQPVGSVLSTDAAQRESFEQAKSKTIVAVGDITTTKLLSFGIIPSLSIIDLTVQRQPYQIFEKYPFPKNARIIRLQSGPGYISKDALEAIGDWKTDVSAGRTIPYVLVVYGEEDLLALPVISDAPVGAVVYYGQPACAGKSACAGKPPKTQSKEGMVEVIVTDELKTRVQTMLDMFILK